MCFFLFASKSYNLFDELESEKNVYVKHAK